MFTVLDLKVGSKLKFRDSATGLEMDAEVAEFPKIIRVKTEDGALHDIRSEDVTEIKAAKVSGGRFQSRLQPRL